MVSPNSPPGNQNNRARDLEIQLFEKIDSRLDSLADDVRDVRERVIRIEAQDVSGKINALEARITILEKWQSRMTGQITLIVVPIAALIGALAKWGFSLIGS